MEYTIENFKKGLFVLDNRDRHSDSRTALREIIELLRGDGEEFVDHNYLRYGDENCITTDFFGFSHLDGSKILITTVKNFYNILSSKLKIGDYVTITEVCKYDDGEIGDVCKLVEIDHNDEDIPFKIDHPEKGYIWCKNMRKATQKEIDNVTKDKLYTIEDLTNGDVALINEDHHDVEKVLRLAFPEDRNCKREDFNKYLNWKYLSKASGKVGRYNTNMETSLPIQYAKDFIKQINTKEDEQNSSNVQRITSENRKPNITGTVILRCGRQQITTGIRPKGNISLPNTGKTRTSVLEIRKNIIQSENY